MQFAVYKVVLRMHLDLLSLQVLCVKVSSKSDQNFMIIDHEKVEMTGDFSFNKNQ